MHCHKLCLSLPSGHPRQPPSASLRAAPHGATISALPRSVGVPLDDHIANLVRFLAPLP